MDIKFQQNGITVVVGPNGCGKSNVVDAVRWVLGEQSAKQLRGGSMEDVIFNGSSFQKPMGMAEVTLTFSNTEGDTIRNYAEYSEIAITRRLYRSGESSYMINKTPVRLKDIRELFMDTGVGGTGYSIIEQGRVGEIVSARSFDRRILIDDAAGIVKFRLKREAAERRMEETLQNLLRVNDVLGELREQEEGLVKHVERAKSFLELKELSEKIDKQLLCLNWHEAGKRESKSKESLEKFAEQQKQTENEKALLETRIQQLSLEQTQRGADLQQRREKVHEKERGIQDAENQRKLEQQALENLSELQERQKEELEELHEKLKFLKGDWEARESRSEKLIDRLSQIEASIVEIEKEKSEEGDALHEASSRMQQMQKNLLRVHTELTNQTNQGSFLVERLDSFLERQKKLQEQDQSHRELHEEVGKKLSGSHERTLSLRQLLDTLEEKIQVFDQSIETESEAIADAESQLIEVQYQQSVARSRLESLEKIQNSYEGFSDSVKTFMHLMQEDPEEMERLGVLGIVADFVKAEPEAVEQGASVMAEVLDWVVLEKADRMSLVESFCNKQDIGALRFIALDRLQPKQGKEPEAENLSTHLEFEPQFKEWGNRFFSRFLLQGEVKAFWSKADSAWPGAPWEWISSIGTRLSEISAGIGKPQSASLGVFERQHEITELQNQAEEILERCSQMEEEIEKKQEHLEFLNRERQDSVKQQRESELEWLSTSKELEHHQQEQKRLSALLDQNRTDLESLSEEIELHRQRRENVNQSLETLESQREELEEKTAIEEERIQTFRQRVEEVSEKLVNERMALTETMEQQKNLLENEQRLQGEHLECERRIESLKASGLDGEQRREAGEKRISEIDSSFDGLIEQREVLQKDLDAELEVHENKNEEQQQFNQELQGIQQKLAESTEQLHQQSLKGTEFRMQREQLENQLAEISEQTPEELYSEMDPESLDRQAMSIESRSLKQRINAMGYVNLGAPEEYEALMERIGFLSNQSEDLQQAVDDLKQTIRDINNESRKRFREMFDQVNLRFNKVFTTLFEGGEARMVLTESEDLLDAGIDIVAQPPGKKLQNLNLLSGGEKALTAISLIFAIFLIKPSPFCLLDEVDAPLDDVNVVRFTKLIKSLTENSQFIVITHNKKTMEIGHLLYGVTMENPGISKTVSVQFQDAERMIA